MEAGLVDQLQGLGWKVDFEGHHLFEDVKAENDPDIGIVKRPQLVSKVNEAVSTTIGKHAAAGYLPLTIGGDHSLVSALAFLRSQPDTDGPSWF